MQIQQIFPVDILGNLLSPAEVVRNLGVWFGFSSCHVRNTCKACFVDIIYLKQLRGYLMHEAALWAANTLVGSHLDYCNSLFRGVSALAFGRLQCIQNSVARILHTYLLNFRVCLLLEIKHYNSHIGISLLSERLFIGCFSSITLFLR